MRRQPGSWLRAELFKRDALVFTVALSLAGIMLGMLMRPWLPELGVGIYYLDYLALIVGAIALLLVFVVGPRLTRNIEKGLNAESRIGQAIDYAVAAPGCAVAHDVTEIAKYGNIDHVVLTPARLWVIETKSGRVPRNEFRKALGQIAANVEAAREWVRREWEQKDTDVRGCLVLASGEVTDRDKQGYDASGEKIPVEDRDSLWRTLREEARAGPAADNADVQRVWALGKMK